MKSPFIFLIFCIGTRFALAYIAKTYPKREYAYPAILLTIAWMLIWSFSLRETGQEVLSDDKKIWWNNMRPLHAILYALFAYNIYYLNNFAYKFLVVDALLGLGAFLFKNYLIKEN